MAKAEQIAVGQRTKVIRFQTGVDLNDYPQRAVILRLDDAEPVVITGVAIDPASPGDMLLVSEDYFDTEGTYAVGVGASGEFGVFDTVNQIFDLKCDDQITIEAVTIGEPDLD